MIDEAARLHGKVHRAGARILRGRRAGHHLELIHCVDAHSLRNQPVVSLLTNRFGRHAIQVKLTQVISGTADDRQAAPALRAGSQSSKRRWVALGVVHL